MKQINLEITSDIVNLIAEIDEFKGKWEALKNLAPESLNNLRKVATIESIGSSTRIEGARLSDQEIEKLLSQLDYYSFQSRDEEEVAGYAEAMNLIFDVWQEFRLTENHIKQLHSILLKHSSKDQRHKGEYKKFSNNVEAFDAREKSLGIIFETTKPFDTPRAMEKLLLWLERAQNEKKLHPLLVIAIFIVRFLAIHPFQDGNGRLSRILNILMLLQAGYAYVPFSSLENVIEQNKDKYYMALRKTQKTLHTDNPDWQPWLMFFLRLLQKQKNNLARKIDQEKLLSAALPSLSIEILKLVKNRGQIKISDIEKITGAPRSTIKVRLQELVKNKQLVRHGKGRASWYALI